MATGAAHGSSSAGSEQTLGEVLIKLNNQLNQTQTSLNSIPDRIKQDMVDLIKNALNEVQGTVLGTVQSLVPTSATQNNRIQPLQHEIKTLKAQMSSLINAKTALEQEVSSLRMNLYKKSREAQRLHEIIVQTGQKGEIFTDEEIIKKFGVLHHGIMRTVSNHFSKSDTLPRMLPSDFVLLKRSKIAQELFGAFFGPNVRLFGLNIERERAQQELELKLRDQGVSEPDITEWRIALVKVAMKVNWRNKYDYANKISDKLFDDLQTDCSVVDEEMAQKDIDELCGSAWDIALLLRTSTSAYKWLQDGKVDQIPPADVQRIGSCSVRGDTTSISPDRILFGPLYKVVDGEMMLLRQGDVLHSD